MKKIIAFAAVAAVLASCSNDEDFAPQQSLKDTPITVAARVAELTSRAGYEGTASLPATFYLTIDQDGEKYDYTNIPMTKGDGTTTYTSETQLLWAGNSAVSVTAATFSLDGTQTLAAQTDQSKEDDVIKSDHLYYQNSTVTPSGDGSINVNFSHIMSKVILKITLGDEFDSEDNPISDVTFKGTVASNSYTAGTGWATIATEAATADIKPREVSYTKIGNGVKNAGAEYEVILVPQTVAAKGFAVQFNVGNRIFNWTSASEVNLENGHKYSLVLTAGKDKVSSASFSVSNWETDNDSNNVETE